ncbi:MAG: ribokinase [Alphaproteobacteria bacterium]
MSSNSIVVLGSLHYDIYIKSNSIPKIGETVLAEKWFPKLGGKGANQAVALNKELIKVKFISAIGNDFFSEFLIKRLQEENISLENISKVKGNSGISVAISNKSGDYSAVVVSGANLEIPETLLYDNNLWKDASFLMIQNEIKEEMNLAAAKEAKKRNIKVFLNAAPAKKINYKLFECVDILLVNEIEAQQLSEDYSCNFDTIATKLSKIVSKVIITLGSEGVILCEKDNKPIHIKGYSVNVKSAHGAGDYFAGNFLIDFIKNNDFENSIRVANKKTAEFISTE